MTAAKRRTLWRMKGDAPLSEGASDLYLNGLCSVGDQGRSSDGDINPVSSIAIKVSLAAAIGVFATMAPAAPALGGEVSNIRTLKAADSLESDIVFEEDADHNVVAVKADPEDPDVAPADDDGESADQDDAVPEDADDPSEAPDADAAALSALFVEEGGEEIVAMSGTMSVNSQASLEAAIASMDAVGTINLSASFTISSPIEIPSNADLTIKLNGKTLTGNCSTVFNMAAGASLTVSGPGTVNNISKGNVFTASGRIGGLLLDGSALFTSGEKVFGDISKFAGTRISAGCGFSDAEGLFTFKDNYQDGQEITYSDGHFVLVYWPDPEKESWYAKFLFVYCPTEADYELYTKRVGSENIELPVVSYMVTFRSSTGAIVKQDTVLKGHCVGDRMGGNESAPPSDVQMQSLAPEGHTFEGWVDPKGNLLSISQISAIPVMSDVTYTARYKAPPVSPVGPTDPSPAKPITPGPSQPAITIPNGSFVGNGAHGGSSALSSSPSKPAFPRSPIMPWNPPGLALAAGFTVPETGPGVVILDEFGEPLTAGAGGGDGDAPEDGISLFDADSKGHDGLQFSSAEVVRTLALVGGTALTALIASRVASFMAANANTPRKRRRKALGLV